MLGWESKLRSNYGFQRIGKKIPSPFLTQVQMYASFHAATSTAGYTPSVLSPGWFWRRYKNQKTSHISDVSDVPQVKSDQHQWSDTANFRWRSGNEPPCSINVMKQWEINILLNPSLIYSVSLLNISVSQTGISCCVPICPPMMRFTQSRG